MSSIYSTRKIVEELEIILGANEDIQFVSSGALEPLASESNSSAVYISPETITFRPERLQTASSGYDRRVIVNLYCNYDGTDDALGVFDFIDSVERSILQDSDIWSTVLDRDLIAIEFDNHEHTPRRAVTMVFDISFRLLCD